MELSVLQPNLAAEVKGIDIVQGVSDQDETVIEPALQDYPVLVLRNQCSRMTTSSSASPAVLKSSTDRTTTQ